MISVTFDDEKERQYTEAVGMNHTQYTPQGEVERTMIELVDKQGKIVGLVAAGKILDLIIVENAK